MVIGLAQVAQVEQLLFKKNNKNLKELSINGLNSTLKKLFENWRFTCATRAKLVFMRLSTFM